MNYTLSECCGKLRGDIINLTGDSLEDAVKCIDGAVIFPSYDKKPLGLGKVFSVREWDTKYFDGREILGKFVFIPRSLE